jgi:hypothetical protein
MSEPMKCLTCRNVFRPRGTRKVDFPHTVAAGVAGLCLPCYKLASPSGDVHGWIAAQLRRSTELSADELAVLALIDRKVPECDRAVVLAQLGLAA